MRSMFKRILIMAMFAMIMSVTMNVTSIANASPQTDLLGKYKNLSISLEVGMNFLDFKRAYRQLYVDTRNLQSQMTNEEYAKFKDVLAVYADASTIWSSDRDIFFYSDIKDYIGDKYKDIPQVVRHDFWGQYERESIVRYLLGQSDTPQKALEKYFADKAKAEQEAKKTAE